VHSVLISFDVLCVVAESQELLVAYGENYWCQCFSGVQLGFFLMGWKVV
jgi:hypothetical protein